MHINIVVFQVYVLKVANDLKHFLGTTKREIKVH